MNSLLLLLGVQLRAILHSFAPGKRRASALLVVAASVFLVAIAAVYMVMLGATLIGFGMGNALPAFAVALSAVAGVAFTFLKANGALFGITDFDLVMSLPIPRRSVVTARVAALYASATIIGAVLAIPLWTMYLVLIQPSAWAAFCAVAGILLAPAIPTSIAIFLAFGVNAVASRFRHASLVYIAVSLAAFTALIVAVYGFSFTAGSGGSDVAAQQIEGGLSAMSSLLSLGWPPAGWLGNSATSGSVPLCLAFIGSSIAVPVLALEIMQRKYLAINAALTSRTRSRSLSASELRKRSSKQTSPFKAIVLKEYRTLLGIPSYAFNCLFGYLFMLVIAGAASIFGLDGILGSGAIDGVEISAEDYAAISGLIANILPWVFVFCSIMCPSAACSISIEGKGSWVMGTAPLPLRTILGAKLASNAAPVAATIAISALILLAGGQIDAIAALEVVLTGFGAFFLMVNIGLSSDARKPNLSWTTPNDVVKRGFPITVVVIGGVALAFAGGAASFALSLTWGTMAGTAWNLAVGALCLAAGWLVFQRTCRIAKPYLVR